jgi:hypothetical protein
MASINKQGCNKRSCFFLKNDAGLVVEGFLAAFFTGMALCIIIFSWYPTSTIFTRWHSFGYIGIVLFIFLVMLIIYWGVVFYRRRSFEHGGLDHLLIRSLRDNCLAKDCGEFEQLLSDSNVPEIVIFNQMLLCQLQAVVDIRVTKMQEMRTRFRESGIKRIHGLHLERLFFTPKTYERMPLPYELEEVFKSIKPFESLMSSKIVELKNCRQALFTLMSDYLDLFLITSADVEKLKRTYCYNPPDKSLAQKIIFANRAINYFKDYEQEKLSSERKSFMQIAAVKRIEQLKIVMSNYHNAWKNLIKAYDALPLKPNRASKSVKI